MYLFLPTGEREYEATNSVSSCLLLFTWYWKRREYYYYGDQWQLNKHFLHEHEQCFRFWCWRHMWVIEFVVGSLFCSKRFFSSSQNQHFQIPIQSGKHCQTSFKNKFIRTPKCFMGRQITIYNCFYHQIHMFCIFPHMHLWSNTPSIFFHFTTYSKK